MISFITIIIEITILAVINAMGIFDIGNLLATAMIVMFSLSFFVTVQRSKTIEKYSNQLLAGYIFRIILLYFDLFGNSIRALPQSGADTWMFYSAAEQWVLYGIKPRRGFFIYVLCRVFEFIGVNRLYSQFLLMLFSIASLILYILIIDELVFDEEIKVKAAWILCLLPNFALLSSIFLRESLVTFLITISIYFFIKWSQGRGTIFFVFATLLSLSSCLFHSGCIGITIGCMICLLLYDPYEQKIHASLNGTILAFVIALGIAFLFLNYSDSLLGKFTNMETLKDIANTSGGGGSSYVQYVGNSDNPVNMLIFTIPRIVYFLFSPFPWQWRGITDIIAFFFSGLFYLVAIKNAIVYLQGKERHNKEITICLFIIVFFCTFVFAWGVSNTGTASRHRDKMVCLYGIIYALTTSRYRTLVNNKY